MRSSDTLLKLKVGVAGVGAIGRAVCRALLSDEGIEGLILHRISDLKGHGDMSIQNADFKTLARECDLIVECLPATQVPALADAAFEYGRPLTLISSAALLLYPDILEKQKGTGSRIYVPSGALAGLDGVKAMKEMGIERSLIASTKPPKGFEGAPYVVEKALDLAGITEKTLIFSGNALDASRAFPANVNVAATLSLAGIGPEKTRVEVWADPAAKGNTHEISVSTAFSTLNVRIENMPDPANPKSSVLAAQSIVTCLRDMSRAIVIG
ncbi:MAG: DUF108 domain-containing protein [Alphaproteobacteria bacterium]|nr:DUF108 domain-containing protein [Alphaproteobacteria bacterium]MCB9975461.1 DUF108 domain-containing protein [Rhodospirillales bacterium]